MNLNDCFRSLQIGVPGDIARLQGCGDFEEAIRRIDEKLARPKLTQSLRESLLAHREILRRLPADYPLTASQAVELARRAIPDFTAEELEKLEQDGRVDWITYRGEPYYSASFFNTLCKTDVRFAERAGSAWGGSVERRYGGLPRQELIRKMKEQGEVTLRFRCRESLRIRDELFRPHQRLRAYLPLPCLCEGQHDIQLLRTNPMPTARSLETADQPVVYWEKVLRENHAFTAEYACSRTARYIDPAAVRSGPVQPDFDTGEVAPHIVFTPYLRVLTEELAQGAADPLEKARRFYDFVTRQVRYFYMRSYFCLENIADTCARDLMGDCGVQVLLFVTLCRCAGIPARFHGGWRGGLAGDCSGSSDWRPVMRECLCHDWAEFYIAPAGWLYADPAFGGAALRGGDTALWNFYFGNLDPLRLTTNGNFQAGFGMPENFWRIDPFDSQCGEMETDERGLLEGEFDAQQEILEFREEPAQPVL